MRAVNKQPPEEFDARAFRNALGHFATGISIVTARGSEGDVIGMTMTSFNSVSLDPPLVLFSVARSAYSLPAMLNAQSYGVNLLDSNQQHLSDRFARASSDKWADVAYACSPHGAPLLENALAHFECAPYAHHDGGDHVIFLARVLRFATAQEGGPLIFFRGGYHRLASPGV
ncbi:MAG: flavin reductase family protein [Xanthobacter sp.]